MHNLCFSAIIFTVIVVKHIIILIGKEEVQVNDSIWCLVVQLGVMTPAQLASFEINVRINIKKEKQAQCGLSPGVTDFFPCDVISHPNYPRQEWDTLGRHRFI